MPDGCPLFLCDPALILQLFNPCGGKTMRALKIGYMIPCLLISIRSGHGDVIYVDLNATGADTGADWTNAHCDLQTAIARSSSGDEIWVAQGIYIPTQSLDRAVSFNPRAGTSILGGFLGGEDNRDDRNPLKYPTILSGNIGNQDSNTDNTFRVVQCMDLSPPPLLDGIVIRDAYNDRSEADGRGGGVYNLRADVALLDCIIEDNYALGGGGVWNENASPTLIRTALRHNSYCGVINWSGGNMSCIECEFADNDTRARGGAFNAWTYYHQSTFFSCQFLRNHADGLGGAYYGVGDPAFVDCFFVDNTAGDYAGVAYLHVGTARFTNCTLFRNHSDFLVGGIFTHSDDSTPIITNCLLWGNTAERGSSLERYQLALHAGSVNYCCIEGWTGDLGGVGNFGDDPRFVDADKENLRLRDDSPCVDAGDDSVVTQPTDLDGNPRILGARVDIGCYESLCPAIVALDLKCTNSGKLKATATTTLPEGATVRFTQPDAQGRPKAHPAAVNRRAKAVAKWRPDSDAAVCIEGCSQPCKQQTCP